MRSDAELLDAWQQGDSPAGRLLFERYFDAVSRFFANKVNTDHDDLIQETFAGCISGVGRLRDASAFRSYLFGIAYNVLKKHYRRRMRPGNPEALESLSVQDLAAGPSTLLRDSEQERRLLDALQGLPLELQVVLEMHYWEGMGSPEIGDALGIPAGTVRSRMHRGRDLLGRALAVHEASVPDQEIERRVRRVRDRLEPEQA